MNAMLTRAYIASLRLGWALRRYWKRIALGAFCGWLVSSVLGAFALVWLESRDVISPDQTAPIVGAALVWSGIALGGLLAYAARPGRVDESLVPARSARR